MKGKSFSFTEPEDTGPFDLDVNGEKIQCRGVVDGLKLLEFTAAMRGENGGGVRATALIKWLRECVVDWDEFQKVVDKHKLRIEHLGEIGGYLGDVYSELGDPTEPAQPSTAGQQSGGSSPEESSSSEGSTTAA